MQISDGVVACYDVSQSCVRRPQPVSPGAEALQLSKHPYPPTQDPTIARQPRPRPNRPDPIHTLMPTWELYSCTGYVCPAAEQEAKGGWRVKLPSFHLQGERSKLLYAPAPASERSKLLCACVLFRRPTSATTCNEAAWLPDPRWLYAATGNART